MTTVKTMTNDKHVRVIPSTRPTKIKEPVRVVSIEVNYVLRGKIRILKIFWIAD